MFVTDELSALDAELQELVGTVGEVQVQQAPSVWKLFDHIERLAASAKVMVAGKLEQSEQWRRDGHRSAADYMAAEAGTTAAEARRELEASHRLGSCPATADAMAAGRLSKRQAASIVDAASANPDAEQKLLALAAGDSVSELEKECGRVKAAADPDPEATERRVHSNRCWLTGTSSDGGAWAKAYGSRRDISAIDAVLAPIVDELFNQARRQGRHEPREAYAFDALLRLVKAASAPEGRDEDESAETKPKRPRQQPVRTMTLLRADLVALINGTVAEGEVCEIAGYGPVPVSVLRALLGESVVKLVLTKGEQVVNVTHLGRGPRVAELIALLWERPQCSRLGCPRRLRLEIDHGEQFARTRCTRREDLDPLCEHDHDLKTYQGWSLIEGTGRRPMVPPDHPHHPKNKPKAA